MEECKSGVLSVTDGQSQVHKVKLVLYNDALLIQKEEWVNVPLDDEDEVFLNMVREVEIEREGSGGLGLCVKGGAEHRLPVLISRIIKNHAADRCKQLLVGDAILRVNGINVETCTHDEVVTLLKQAEGSVITLAVRHFRPASHFLNRNNGHKGEASVTSTSAADTVLPVETGDESLGFRHIPALPRLEKQFLTAITIPLLYARLSRYLAGTDMLRDNAFEVMGVDGSFSGPVTCEDNRSLAEWLQALSTNTQSLLSQMIQMTNRLLPPADHIMHMVWSNQRMSADKHQQPWKPKFLSLKAADIYLFDQPPMHSGDWSRCDAKYKVYECMFKVLKDDELPDDRQHCCSVQTGGRDLIILSMDSRADLLHLEKAWYHTSNTAVRRLVSKTFGCTWRGKLSGLILDMDQGFSLYDHDSKSFLWTYRFAQLKGSSDDGRTKLKLQFNADTKHVDTRELECTDLQTLLFCIHAFLSAKLSTVDPAFLSNY
ncbi:gamma-1-syntrophin-like [Littorina saxatilis]|uniref:PDZ domain-containing protein n=1 Tax=Littorina saxatilis TaxID=31220 RepID=A0AAN9AQF4_9CAEN